MKIFAIIAGILVGLSCIPAAQAEPVHLDGALRKIPIGLNVEFLKDDGGKLTLSDIAGYKYRNSWFKTKDAYPRFGWTESAIWARITVVNITNTSIHFFLEHAYPLIDDLQFYAPGPDGRYHVIQTGDTFNFSRRPYDSRTFVFPLECEARVATTYFMRQKSLGFMNYPLILWSPEAYTKQYLLEHSLVIVFLGITLIMILNYLCVFFLIRHINYLYFVSFILSMLVFMFTQSGSLLQFVLPDNPGLATISAPFFLCLANIFGCRYVIIILKLNKNAPFFKTALKIQTWVFIAVLISVGAIPFSNLYEIIMPAAAFLSMATLIIVLGSGIYLAYRKERIAYMFILISLVYMACFIVYFMNAFGILVGSFTIIWIWIFFIGSTMCLLALSIAMVDRMNTMRKGLKSLAEKLNEDLNSRSIELLLSEVASKVVDDASDACRAGAGKNYNACIQSLRYHQRELSIQKLGTDVTIISSFDELIDKTLLKIKELCQAEQGCLYIVNDDPLAGFQAYPDSWNPEECGYSKIIVDSVLESGNYYTTDHRETKGANDQSGESDRRIICVPIRSSGSIVGACYMEKRSSEDFSPREAKMIMDFSDTIFTVLKNALSYTNKTMSDGSKCFNVITGQAEEKIKQAAEYLEANYLSDISREGLASFLDISPNYLGKLFKIYTGRTISEYINELRIRDAARRLMDNENDNVITIAFSVGFESLSTFNRAFMKFMGCTPSVYKEQKR